MILGKFIKLCDKYLNPERVSNGDPGKAESLSGQAYDWLNSLKTAYKNEKK